MTSESQAENTEMFNNVKEVVGIWPSLFSLGHEKPVIPLKIDHSTTAGFVNYGMKPKSSKTWDMKNNWLSEKDILKQIQIYWDKGDNNDTEYFTKIKPPSIHYPKRPFYVNSAHSMASLNWHAIHKTIRLCEGVLIRFLSYRSFITNHNL